MKIDNEILNRYLEAGRAVEAPCFDVTQSVMQRIREQEDQPAAIFVRQLRFEALLAVIAVLLVAIPAQQAVASLLNPMLLFFGSMENLYS
ncbi:MAG: hypothetical protein HYV27_22930 [Candidatus Hydrogenedentes bacterium]|nr:hypothetical protein [Candidatus Hydrogenedentota bacterium]